MHNYFLFIVYCALWHGTNTHKKQQQQVLKPLLKQQFLKKRRPTTHIKLENIGMLHFQESSIGRMQSIAPSTHFTTSMVYVLISFLSTRFMHPLPTMSLPSFPLCSARYGQLCPSADCCLLFTYLASCSLLHSNKTF